MRVSLFLALAFVNLGVAVLHSWSRWQHFCVQYCFQHALLCPALVHPALHCTLSALVTLLKLKQHSLSLSTQHTHGRHKTDTSASKERKEDRVICLANFSASILIAANSNSSCQVLGYEQSTKKCIQNTAKMLNTLKNSMLYFNVEFWQFLGDKHVPYSLHVRNIGTKCLSVVSFERAIQTIFIRG